MLRVGDGKWESALTHSLTHWSQGWEMMEHHRKSKFKFELQIEEKKTGKEKPRQKALMPIESTAGGEQEWEDREVSIKADEKKNEKKVKKK